MDPEAGISSLNKLRNNSLITGTDQFTGIGV
jgi:hypothetical protein